MIRLLKMLALSVLLVCGWSRQSQQIFPATRGPRLQRKLALSRFACVLRSTRLSTAKTEPQELKNRCQMRCQLTAVRGDGVRFLAPSPKSQVADPTEGRMEAPIS
jgi:hypothetical protein